MASKTVNLVLQVSGAQNTLVYTFSLSYRKKRGRKEIHVSPFQLDNRIELEAGTYILIIRSEGFKEKEVEVRLEGAEESDHFEFIELEPLNMVELRFGDHKVCYAAMPNRVAISSHFRDTDELRGFLKKIGEKYAHVPSVKALSKSKKENKQRHVLLSAYQTMILPRSKKRPGTAFKNLGDKTLKKFRDIDEVQSAGIVLAMTKDGPVFLTNRISLTLDPHLKAEQVAEIFKNIGAESYEIMRGSGNIYSASFDAGMGLGVVELLDTLWERDEVLDVQPEIQAPVVPEIVVPNDFLWPATVTRNTMNQVGNAWELLQNNIGANDTYGNSDIVIAVIDTGVLSVGGVPDNPDFQGTVSDTANTTLTAAVTTAPRSVITVDSVAGIAVSDVIDIGRGEDRFKTVHARNAGTNELTIDPLFLDHPGRTVVLDNPSGVVRSRLAAGGASAKTTVLTVGSVAGFRVGQSIAVGAEGAANTEHAVITAIAGSTLTVTGLTNTHPIGTAVQSGRKVYMFRDMDPGNFVANNDGITGTHGTACAGVATAKANNGTGSAGIAPNARLLAIKSTGFGANLNVYRDIFQWVGGVIAYPNGGQLNLLQPGADVMTISLGLGNFTGAQSAQATAALSLLARRGRDGRGTLVFMSAGNDDRPAPAGRWSANVNSFANAATFVAQFGGAGGYTKEIRTLYSDYSNVGAIGTNPTDLDWAASSGNSVIGPGSAIPNSTGAINIQQFFGLESHNPPVNQRVVTTYFTNQGNVPQSATNTANATAATAANNTLTMSNQTVLAGGTSIPVANTAGFAMGDWICLGNWDGDVRNNTQWTQITGVVPGAPGTLNVTALTSHQVWFAPPSTNGLSFGLAAAAPAAQGFVDINFPGAVGNFCGNNTVITIGGNSYRCTGVAAGAGAAGSDRCNITPNVVAGGHGAGAVASLQGGSAGNILVYNSSVVTVDSTAGFVANEWVLVGPPNSANCVSANVQSVIGANTMRIMGPENAVTAGVTQIVRGPLHYENRFNGTSAASPNGAGIGALVLSAKKTLTWLEVKNLLQTTARKIDIGTTGFTATTPFGGGTSGPQDGQTGDIIRKGRWFDVGGNPILTPGGPNIVAVGAADAIAAGAPVVVGDTTINVNTPALFNVGDSLQVGAGAGSDYSVVYAKVGAVLTVEPMTNAWAPGTVVQKGRIPAYSSWYGTGRLDPTLAVQAALNYSHDQRDLMIRNFMGDDGVNATDPLVNPIQSPDIFLRNANDIVLGPSFQYTDPGPHQIPANGIGAPAYGGAGLDDIRVRGYFIGGAVTNYVIEIDGTAGPDTFKWSSDGGATFPTTGVPIVANADHALGANGVIITFQANAGHTMGDQWTIIATPQTHFIFTRVHNRGNPLPSLAGTNVRTYLALTDGSLIGNGKTPFHLPMGWDDAYPIANVNAATESAIYVIPNALLVGSPQDTPVAPIAANADGLFPVQWNNTAMPPNSIDLKLFLLSEVNPHDGVLGGLSPEANNNISYREIFFGEAQILNAGGTAALEDEIEVDNAGTVVATGFTMNLKANLGQFNAANVEVVMRRRDLTGTTTTSVFKDTGGAVWAFDGIVPGWCTVNAPVQTGTATPAAGSLTEITFTGTFDSDNTGDQVILEIRLKGVHDAIVLTQDFEVTVFSLPDISGGVGNGTKPKETPRPHEFADMPSLTPQIAGQAFGPDTGTPLTKFRTTTSFNNGVDVAAYAAMQGFVFVQKQDATRVNLFLKPLLQTGIGFTRVKYFVYRGLKLDQFLKGPNAPDYYDVASAANASPFVNELRSINNDINTALGTADPLLPKSFGWDPDNQTDPNAIIDDFFYNPDPAHQLGIAEKGMHLGDFVSGALSGFEVVLEDGRIELDLAYARLEFNEIDVSGIAAGLEEAAARETILAFADPAAFYGMHYFAGVIRAGGAVDKDVNMYNNVMTPFLHKNRVYFDFRNHNGYSLNYYGNYVGAGGDPNPATQLRLRDPNAVESYVDYKQDNWPLYWFDTNTPTTSKVNLKFVRFRKADNDNPVLFSEHGQFMTTHQQNRFVDTDTLNDPDEPKWTKEVGVGYANFNSTGTNVSTIIKLHFCRALPTGTGAPTKVILPNDFNDTLFGPIEALIRERAITVVDQGTKTFTVSGNFSSGIDPGEAILIAGSTGNDGKYTVSTVTFTGADTEIVVVEPIPNATADGTLQFSYTLWNTDKPTRWFSGFRKHFLDATSQPLNLAGTDPLMDMSLIMEAGAAVDTDRVVFYAQPYKFLEDNTADRTTDRINLQGGVGKNSSLWTELENLDPQFSLSATLLKFGATLIPVFEFDRIDPNNAANNKKENFSAIGITDAEFTQIKEAVNAGGFSPHHEKYLKLVPVGGAPAQDDNAIDYLSFEIHIQGWDAAGASQTVSSQTGAYPGPVTVYTLTENQEIYTSEAYSNIENLVITDPTYEEGLINNPGPQAALLGDPTMNTLVGNFNTSLSAITDNKAAIEALVEADSRQLWDQAVAFNSSAPYDDKPVYWARLHHRANIKAHPFLEKQRKLRRKMIEEVEAWSRGWKTVDFSVANPAFASQPAGAKKILVTGFDPFDGGTYNPSGLVALALHNKTLTMGGDTGLVQSALFPVRWEDFDRKVVEKFMEKYLDPASPDKVDMIITLSLWEMKHFYLERFASRYREGSITDNLNATSKKSYPGFGLSWKQFFETTLPVSQIVNNLSGYPTQEIYYNQYYDGTVTNNKVYPIDPQSTAINAGQNVNTDTITFPASGRSLEGSGGYYMSNEIFYRTARLREKLSSTAKTGHIHIPNNVTADPAKTDVDIVTVIENAIERSLSAL